MGRVNEGSSYIEQQCRVKGYGMLGKPVRCSEVQVRGCRRFSAGSGMLKLPCMTV